MIGKYLSSATTLNNDEIEEVKKSVLLYLQEHDFITNRALRNLSGVTYDQAIFFFKQMMSHGILKRVGITTNIRYVIGGQ
jgi:uncharacterized membrane protein